MGHPPGICRAYLVLRLANNDRFCYGGLPDWQDQSLAWWAVTDKVVIELGHLTSNADVRTRKLVMDCTIKALRKEASR